LVEGEIGAGGARREEGVKERRERGRERAGCSTPLLVATTASASDEVQPAGSFGGARRRFSSHKNPPLLPLSTAAIYA
jgi:hypothetical protein